MWAALENSVGKLLGDYWAGIESRVEQVSGSFSSEESQKILRESGHEYLITALKNMAAAMVLFWNASDLRDRSLLETLYNDVIGLSSTTLESPCLHPLKVNRLSPVSSTVNAHIGSLHNFCHNYDAMVPDMRRRGLLRTVSKFVNIESSGKLIYTRSLAILVCSYLITEDDSEAEITLGEAEIQVLINMLRNAMYAKGYHCMKSGFHADELLQGINNISAVEVNKRLLVKGKVLPLLVEGMKTEVVSIQLAAARAVWSLAFDGDNRQEIIDEPGCIEGVYSRFMNSCTCNISYVPYTLSKCVYIPACLPFSLPPPISPLPPSLPPSPPPPLPLPLPQIGRA